MKEPHKKTWIVGCVCFLVSLKQLNHRKLVFKLKLRAALGYFWCYGQICQTSNDGLKYCSPAADNKHIILNAAGLKPLAVANVPAADL